MAGAVIGLTLGVAAATGLSGDAACANTQEVVVTSEEGRVAVALPLGPDRRFALTYRHSVYGVEAAEWFVADCDGRLRMVAVSSPSEAVLDYYAIEGRRDRHGGGWRLRPHQPAAHDELPLMATAHGQRTLLANDHRVPLWDASGESLRLRLRIGPLRS